MGNNPSSAAQTNGTSGEQQKQENVAVTNKHTESGWSEVQNIQYAVSGMQGMRQTMEDRHILCNSLPVGKQLLDSNNLDDHSVFSVFDGHGGDFTSNYLEENFLKTLARRSEVAKYAALPRSGMKSRADVTGIQLLRQALTKTFAELDEKLGPLQDERNAAIRSGKIIPPAPTVTPPESEDEDDDDNINAVNKKKNSNNNSSNNNNNNNVLEERSGSTACAVIITPTHYICANAGDSRAILRRSGQVLPLSFDHKPSDVPERKRIIGAGGVVKGKRVDGDLAVSRAFGDFVFKQDKGLPADRQRVIVVPDIITYPRMSAEDEFIIIACDGVWDVASNRQCSDFVQSMLSEGEVDLANICEEALDTCLDRKSRDNMTMMVIGLPGMKADASGSKIMHNMLWGPRITRASRDFKRATFDFSHRACVAVGSQFLAVENGVCAK